MNDCAKFIEEKARDIAKRHGVEVEKVLTKIISENDCKPSDITIQMHVDSRYVFLVKKEEIKMNSYCTWSPNE